MNNIPLGDVLDKNVHGVKWLICHGACGVTVAKQLALAFEDNVRRRKEAIEKLKGCPLR